MALPGLSEEESRRLRELQMEYNERRAKMMESTENETMKWIDTLCLRCQVNVDIAGRGKIFQLCEKCSLPVSDKEGWVYRPQRKDK